MRIEKEKIKKPLSIMGVEESFMRGNGGIKGSYVACGLAFMLGFGGLFRYGTVRTGVIAERHELEYRALSTLAEKSMKLVEGENGQTQKSGQELLNILGVDHKLKLGQKVVFHLYHYNNSALVESTEYDRSLGRGVNHLWGNTNAPALKKYLKAKWGK